MPASPQGCKGACPLGVLWRRKCTPTWWVLRQYRARPLGVLQHGSTPNQGTYCIHAHAHLGVFRRAMLARQAAAILSPITARLLENAPAFKKRSAEYRGARPCGALQHRVHARMGTYNTMHAPVGSYSLGCTPTWSYSTVHTHVGSYSTRCAPTWGLTTPCMPMWGLAAPVARPRGVCSTRCAPTWGLTAPCTPTWVL